MNVRSNFIVAICVWQIIWFANGLKLSLSNVSSKSAPIKPSSSLSLNAVSCSSSETSQASLLSNISPKSSVLNQDGTGNVFNVPTVVNNFTPTSPSLPSLNSVPSQNIYSNSLKETETTKLGSSSFNPSSYQSLLTGTTSNLKATNNNLLSAIQNSLNVQNKNFVSPPSITSSQSINNGLLESFEKTGSSQINLNNNLFSSVQNVGPLQQNILNNNLISTTQNILDSNSLSNLLSNSQSLGAITNNQGITSNFEETNNNLLSRIQNSINAQNNNLPSQSPISSSLIKDISVQNMGSLSADPLNNNLRSTTQNSELLTALGFNGISSLPNGLLETNSQSSLLPNSLPISSVPNNKLSESFGIIKSKTVNSNIQAGAQSTLLNTINSNIQASSNAGLLGTDTQNNNLITSNIGFQNTNNLGNNFISSQNTGQNTNFSPYLSNLGPLQSNILNNIQNSQNSLSSQIDTTPTQLLNSYPSLSPNLMSNDLPLVSSFNQVNSDFNSVQSSGISNNKLINSLPNTASISNSNNALLNYLTVNNLSPSINPAAEVTNALIQNNVDTNPLLSETLSNPIALSEFLSGAPFPTPNPYNKFALPAPDTVPSQIHPFINADLVSNYNKNVLLQQHNSNLYENAAQNTNNNIQTQNLSTNSGPLNYLQNNAIQSTNLENILLQHLLESRSSPIDTTQNYLSQNIINQNNIFGVNNQNMLNNLANNPKLSNVSNIRNYLYHNLMNKLQTPKPINSKVNSEIDVNNQVNFYPTNNNILTEMSISNNAQNSDFFNTISNTQESSVQTSAEILSKVNNLPRIPTSPPASFNNLINNNRNNPTTANLESITQITTNPVSELYNGVSVSKNVAPTVFNNFPDIINLPQGNKFVSSNNKYINNNIPVQSTLGTTLSETPQLYPEIATLNVLNNLKSSPPSIDLNTPFSTVSCSQTTDISESSEIKTANTISSLSPALSNLNSPFSNLDSRSRDISSSMSSFPTNNIAQPSLLQTLYPIARLPSVSTNLEPVYNSVLLNNINGNIQNNAFPNFISNPNAPNVYVNGIPESIQIKPNPYLPNDVSPSSDVINNLKLLGAYTPEALPSISPEYVAYLNLISKISSQSPIGNQNPDLSSLNLATQLSFQNNLAAITGSNLNSYPYLAVNPKAYNNLYPNLNIDSSLTTNSLTNTESTEISSDGQISVSTSTDSTESSIETVAETTATNPYAIPSIADLPNVLASNYLSLPQLYNNAYNQISPSNLIVPKIENLISTAGLTKTLIDLGNAIATRYIDNLRTKNAKSVFSPPVYNPVFPSPNTVSSSPSIETIIPDTNISPIIPTQPSYPTNLAVPPPFPSLFIESFKEAEQTYPFPFSSLPQTKIQSEITPGPILPTFYPTEFSVYSPSVLPTPNINYPVYPQYFPTPPMNFPPIPPLFPPMPTIIETPILKMGSNGQDARRLIEILLLTGLLNNNDCNDRGTLETLIALMLAT